MATYEHNGLMTYKDDAGNKYLLYPITKKDCVDGMEDIDAHLTNKSNPHGVTAAQIGADKAISLLNLSCDKSGLSYGGTTVGGGSYGGRIPLNDYLAPAGYGGFGESVVTLGIFASESELNTALSTQFSQMANNETRQIGFTASWIGDWTWVGILFKSSADFVTLTVSSGYYSHVSQMTKSLTNGSWMPFEWENPPMLAGVEYRTTRRYIGDPVYQKLVVYTNASALSGATTISVPHGISNLETLVEADTTTAGYLLPYVTSDTSLAVCGWNATSIAVYNGNSSWSAGRSWYFILYYTKTTD